MPRIANCWEGSGERLRPQRLCWCISRVFDSESEVLWSAYTLQSFRVWPNRSAVQIFSALQRSSRALLPMRDTLPNYNGVPESLLFCIVSSDSLSLSDFSSLLNPNSLSSLKKGLYRPISSVCLFFDNYSPFATIRIFNNYRPERLNFKV